MSKKTISIFLAEDCIILQEGFCEYLTNVDNQDYNFNVIETASCGNEVMERIDYSEFDVLVMDLAMPNFSGYDILTRLKKRGKESKILIYSGYDSEEFQLKAYELGAHSFLSKIADISMLEDSIINVFEGKLSNTIMRDRSYRTKITGLEFREIINLLSDKDFEIFLQFGRALTINDVAANLHLTRKAVEYHISNIKRKLNINNSNRLIRVATIFYSAYSHESNKIIKSY